MMSNRLMIYRLTITDMVDTFDSLIQNYLGKSRVGIRFQKLNRIRD